MAYPILHLITRENHDIPASELVSKVSRSCVQVSEQPSFSFDDTETQGSCCVEIIAMNNLHGKRLCELIISKKPKVVMDLRHLIRFDLPGTSREQILNYFRATKTLYVRDPIPWHNMKRRDFISGDRVISQRLEHETIERKQSPVMLFVPKDEHVNLLAAYLNRVFSERSECPWTISTHS